MAWAFVSPRVLRVVMISAYRLLAFPQGCNDCGRTKIPTGFVFSCLVWVTFFSIDTTVPFVRLM